MGGTVVTLLVPLIFLAVGYQSEVAPLEVALQVGVQDIAKQSRMLPGRAWAELRSPQDLAESLAWLGDKTNIRITGGDKQLLVEKVRDLSPPILTRTATLDQGKMGIWRLELSRSLRSLLTVALLMFVPGLLLGLVSFVALKVVPMRAFHLALQEIAVRKTTEERLAKSLSIFSATLESTADGIFVTDVQIEQVGEWVLKTVCTQLRCWQDAAMPPLNVAVNLSGRQLQRNNLSTTIAGILEESGLNPRFLELEVTESMLMHDPQYAVDMLMQIRAKGVVHIDVDDFGTGYSSLSYLKRFPIDALKLDKSFVDSLPHDEDDIAICRAVIALAHSLKLRVIAEGVENDAQLAFLRENGCDVIQGYIVSRPLPADAFARLVQEYQQNPRWFAENLRPQLAYPDMGTSGQPRTDRPLLQITAYPHARLPNLNG